MAKLVVNPTSSSRRELALGRTLLSIGRDPSNDLVLPDAMVSRRHAVIEYRGSQYYLRDCNSSNGSVVNGDRISEKSLRDGDMVAIGSARLLFREEVELEASGKVVQHPSAPRLACAACEAPYRKGDLFCRSCGGRLPEPSGPPKAVCSDCGTVVPLPAQFCNACGARLPGSGEMSPPPAAPPTPEPEVLEAGDIPTAGPESKESARPAAVSASGSGAVEAPAAKAGSGPISEGALARMSPPPPEPVPVRARFPEADPRRPAPGAALPERPAPSRSPLLFDSGVSARAASAPGSPGRRALAFAFDAVVILAGEALVLVPVGSYWLSREAPLVASDVPYVPALASLLAVPLALVLGIAYYVWSWGIRGATPGQRLLELAVEGQDGRFPIGVAAAGHPSLRLPALDLEPGRRLPARAPSRDPACTTASRAHASWSAAGGPASFVDPASLPPMSEGLPLHGDDFPCPRRGLGRGGTRAGLLRAFWELLHDLAVAVLFCFFLVTFVGQAFRVQGTSMLPLLEDGERIIVNKLVYRFRPIGRGDVVVFWYPRDPSVSFIKRVVGLPGDRVELRQGLLFVNDRPVAESYLAKQFRDEDTYAPVEVQKGHYYVLGDHRNSSNDSRSWGEVPERYIYGRAELRFWPLSKVAVVR